MAHLIDKDALVAEIERRLEDYRTYPDYQIDSNYMELCDILSFIDTLEVKEVDLKKAIGDFIYTHDGRKRMELELDWEQCDLTLKGGNAIIKFAKHFFELGLTQKGELYDKRR